MSTKKVLLESGNQRNHVIQVTVFDFGRAPELQIAIKVFTGFEQTNITTLRKQTGTNTPAARTNDANVVDRELILFGVPMT